MRAIVHWLLLFLLSAGPAAAAPAATALEAGESAGVARVVDGDTVVLDRAIGTATEVRLVGIQAPKLPLGRPGFPTWPLAGEAKRALERLVLGRRVTLSFGGRRMDRHGRLLAHLHAADGAWIQGELLRLGLARVYSFADNRALIPEMLALERRARAAGRGIWGHPFYAIRTPARWASIKCPATHRQSCPSRVRTVFRIKCSPTRSPTNCSKSCRIGPSSTPSRFISTAAPRA
ncbi:MAG: thermonuclease family protein [Proteobacteria bacterium]|nr:thermonuclease family protein [Pseudomonadota bacterium]